MVRSTYDRLEVGRVWSPSPRKAVVILGMGLSGMNYISEQYAGLGDDLEGAEIWAVNAAAQVYLHDIAWNMHDLVHDPRHEKRRQWYAEHHSKLNTPLVTIQPLPEHENSYEYPLREVTEEFNETYFPNGVCYLIAAALLCGVETLGLYGCDYNYGPEVGKSGYETGRCGVEYWLGLARGRGVNLVLPASTHLCDIVPRQQMGLYGYFLSPRITSTDGKTVTFEGFDGTAEEPPHLKAQREARKKAAQDLMKQQAAVAEKMKKGKASGNT